MTEKHPPSYWFPLLLSICILLIFPAVSGLAQTESPSGDGYVGDEKCKECHEDVLTALSRTAHGSKAFAAHAEHGCETCHGPGKEHAETGDRTNIRVITEMSHQQVTDLCMTCHEQGKTVNWRGGVHERRALDCTQCHSVHKSQGNHLLKTARVEETCASCHQPIKAMLQRTSHHPIREGLMSCSDCHNPHGTDTPKMVIANSNNEMCYQCHTEKRGPFLWDHPPVRENCLTCHNPHGSNHPKLLVSKRPYLCQRCHLDTRHPGTLYDGSNLQTSNREFARSCSNCHLTVHGSNHPSGHTFLR